ncbi:P-loop containing nucleoside triphosphate hydrolase protein [Nemania sp. FL0916]|nr:P-loop containing nucleoside triphosphate hydrolase protein [Nemania sp. FL0916]
MSRGFGSSNRDHIYGLPDHSTHDNHIERIIDHTSNLFSDVEHQMPQIITPSALEWNHESLSSGLGSIADAPTLYDTSDGIDQTVSGHLQPVYHPLNTRGFSSGSNNNQRLSLPLTSNASRPCRVLGDASHHFRPFVSRDPDYRSPFQTDSLNYDDQPRDLEYAPPVNTFENFPSSPLTFPHSLPTLANISQSQPQFLPFAQLTSDQNTIQGNQLFQHDSHLFAPQFHTASATPAVNSSLTSSSPSNAGHSSPSIRMTLESQRQLAKHNAFLPKWGQRLQLGLEHASDIPPIVNNTRLVDPRQSLPDKFRAIFPFQLFNAVQSKCFPLVYGTNDNVVISAPTGSGKTAILELAICKLMSSQGGDNFKIVYQAPTKSLCSEKAREWRTKFSHMNLSCVELTGDTSQAEAHRVGSASIIVTTPEKWDSVTRKWKDHRKLLELIRLVLIDEVHILKDTRGATLEAVVSRMKTIGASIRFVAISATVPNIDDVAKWLGRDHQNQLEPARFEVFGEELRPVKLRRHVYGYDGAPNDFIFEQSLDGKLNLLLGKHTEKKPTMVFCFTRRSCERTARSLAEWWSTCRANDRPWPPPDSRILLLSRDLQELVSYGVAFHHAGLDAKDRHTIEASFLSGQLHVICCTSTLAVGVNLPCHTVVLKGTSHYTDDGPQEYSDLEVMQMLGRAGRPQFDNSAAAIIMTRQINADRYEKLVSGQEPLESTLHRNLLEHINSEIGLGTIQDIETAKKWIGGTFLSVRIRQSPSLYDLDNMEEWCERDVKLLQDHGLVTKHLPLVCTEYGQAMSRYMVQFETMKLLLSIPRGAGVEDMLTVICKATEFKDFRFKPAERAVFRELNKSPLVLYPIRETLTLTWHKIFMIVQIYLGGVDLPTDKDTSFIRQDLSREKRMVFDRLKRLVRCVVDCKAFENDGLGTRAALELSRSIAAQAWENKPVQLSQIPGFGPVAVRKWISHGVHTVLGVAEKSVLDIERIASRNPPYGRSVQKILENFPRLTLKADIIESRAPGFESDDPVSVTVKVHIGHRNTKAVPCWKDRTPALTLIATTSEGILAYLWRGNIKKIDKSSGLHIKFPVALTAPNQTITCHFTCEEIVGTQVTRTLEPNIPASVFQNIRRHLPQATVSGTDIMNTEDYEEISDEAMLKALDLPAPCSPKSCPKSPGTSASSEEDFPLIDELLSQESERSTIDPPKMDNGRYFCNHQCRNGGVTKLGKPCNHKCCREGVDKYRPPKQPKSSEPNRKSENNKVSQLELGNTDSSENRGRENTKRANSNSRKNNNHKQTEGDHPSQGIPTTKRTHSLDDAPTPKRFKLAHLDSLSSDLSNVECVDLSNVSDGATSSGIEAYHRTAAQNHRQKLLCLHEEVKGDGIMSSRLTKSCSQEAKDTGDNNNNNHGISNVDDVTTANINTNKICKSDGDDPFSDTYDEMSDLPDLNELFGPKGDVQQPNRSETISPRLNLAADETLYPGVVNTLKESIDYGLKPNLSFTTIEELQKASSRFDLRTIDDTAKLEPPLSQVNGLQDSEFRTASSLLPGLDMMDPMSLDPGSVLLNSGSDQDSHCFANSNSPAPMLRPDCGGGTYPPNEPSGSGEPAWLAELDPELIDSLRGLVNFID